MMPGRGRTARRFDLALLMLVIAAAASERVCAACGETVKPGETCCPEACS